jgi:peptide chain release factor 1
VSGDQIDRLDREGGNIRVQRVSATERRGRVHSSTVTVAILKSDIADIALYQKRQEKDFEIEWFNGTVGAGGQFRNKTATSIRLKHKPTGIVQTAQTRSRENSHQAALAAMHRTLDDAMEAQAHNQANAVRRSQIGSGMRASEKRRTFRFQEDTAIDHLTGKTARASEVMKGKLDLLWN